MFMKMKSALGRAALEEITEQTPEGVEEKEKQEQAPEAGAPAEGADATAPAEGGAEGGETGEGGASDEGAAPEGEAASADAGADEQAPAEGGETEGQKADADDAAATSTAADDVESNEAPEIGEEVEGGETAEVIAEEMQEVEETSEKVDGAAEDLEKLQQATESLNTTIDILNASMQRGGLDPYGSALLRQNLKMSLESIGQDSGAILLPALEDADSPSSRMGMVGDAVEAIKRFLARIAKAIADGFKKFVSWLGEVWGKLTDAFARLKSRAEKLKAMAKGAEMTDTITSKGVLKAFVFGAQKVDDFSKAATEYCEAAKVLGDASTYDSYISALQAIEKGVKDNKSAEEIEVAANAELKKMYDKIKGVSKRYLIIFNESYVRGAASSASGGANMAMSAPGARVTMIWTPTSLKEIGGLASANAPTSTNESTLPEKALDEKQAIALCDKVIATCDWFQKAAKGNKESAAKFAEEVKKQSDTIMVHVNAAIDANKEPGDQSVFRSVGNWVSRATYSLPKIPCFTVTRAAPGALSSILDVVAASIKKAGGKEAGATSGAVATV